MQGRPDGDTDTTVLTAPINTDAVTMPPQETDAGVARLALENVAYTYPSGVEALAGASLEVREGSVVAVVGPSGCGKSTLLSLVAGILSPSAGRVVWGDEKDGRESGSRVSRRRFSLVFQKDTLLPWLTVEANVGFGLRYLSMTRSERQERCESLIEMAGLSDFRKAYPYQLSGGMRRRVAFLAGVAPQPEVLLLDEPFSALDEPTRLEIHAAVLAIIRRLGMSVVLVTHDLAEAISLSDVVHVMTARPGRVASSHVMPFPKVRDVQALRETDEFLSSYGTLWHELGQQIRAGAQPPQPTGGVKP
jgi:NitT/TauT family transport system ATP-binding protein